MSASQDQSAGEAEVIADRVLAFLRGHGPAGVEGRTLDKVLGWDYGDLERVHDYIQWLFPIDEPSRSHPKTAPMLTPRAVAAARADPLILKNVGRGLEVFLRFLGLEWVEERGGARRVSRRRGEDGFEARSKVAWRVNAVRVGNHNWMRVSRVLKCLRLLGMQAELEAVYSRLERLWARGRIPAFASETKTTEMWRACAGDPWKRPMPKHGSSWGVTHTLSKYAAVLGCQAPRQVGEAPGGARTGPEEVGKPEAA